MAGGGRSEQQLNEGYDMETSEVLNRAADLIEERGWATGEGWTDIDRGGPICLEGGIAAAMGMDHALTGRVSLCPAYKAVRDHLGKAPFIWNDGLPHDPGGGWVGGSREAGYAYGREQVIEVLRATAVIEAARESTHDGRTLVAQLPVGVR